MKALLNAEGASGKKIFTWVSGGRGVNARNSNPPTTGRKPPTSGSTAATAWTIDQGPIPPAACFPPHNGDSGSDRPASIPSGHCNGASRAGSSRCVAYHPCSEASRARGDVSSSDTRSPADL